MRFMNRFPSLLTLAWLPAVLLLAPTNAFAANTNAAITVSLVGDVPGNSATYTIEVTNNAPGNNPVGVDVVDNFPADFQSVSWSCTASGGISSCLPTGTGDINDLTAFLDSNGTLTYTATGTIAACATGTLSNTATVSVDSPDSDSNLSNNTDTDNTALVPSADVSITKTDGVASATPGNSVTYTIVATNAGPSCAPNVSISDVFPADIASTSWTCSGSGGGTCGSASGTGNIATTDNLTVGASTTYTVTANIDACATGTISNTATATPAVSDPVGGNNSATDNDTALTPSADVSITKTDGVTSATPGDSVTYTIVASNAGPSCAPSVSISDVFPSEISSTSWTCAGAGGASCGTASGSGNIGTTDDLPPGGTTTYTVTANIGACETGSLSNTATATPAVSDPVGGNNSATDSDTNLVPSADVSITKTDGVVTATPGGSVTYTVVATNGGPSCAPSVAISDTFGSEFTSTSWTCTGGGGGSCGTASGTGNIGTTDNLPAGGTTTYTITANIGACETGTISNTASATPTVSDPVGGNNSATDADTALVPSADVSVTKTDGVATATPGGSVTYTIVTSNAGPSCAPSVAFADTFPSEISSTSWACASAGGASCGTASGTGNIGTTDNLPVGGTTTYTVTANIDSCATGVLSNTATVTPAVSDPSGGNNSATDNDTLNAEADLSVTKTDGAASATPGDPTSYTITVSNAGPSCDPAANLVDTFGADLTGVTWTCSGAGGASCGSASGSGNISSSDNLPDGGSVTYTVSATIDGCATGTLSNTATINSSVTDPAAGNDSATDTTTLTPEADISVVKTDGQATAAPGDATSYTITVSNAGPSCDPSVSVADTFPATLTGVTWTCAGAGGASCGSASGSGNISTTDDLPDGGSVTYTVSATIDSCTTGTLSNTATATASVTDPAAGNDSSTDNTTLVPEADVSVTKTDGQATAAPGDATSYTITVSNAGPSCDPSVSVADTFPATLSGVTWTCAGAGGASCGSASGSGNIATTDDLPDGGSVTYTVNATIDSCSTGTLSNTASATTSVTDPAAGNNSATDNTTLTPEADISITKTDGAASATPGDPTSYTITVTNSGPSCDPAVGVADTFGADLSGVTWTCAGAGGASCGSASGSGNIATSDNLPDGGSVTYTVSATIDSCATGTLSNTATATASVTDPSAGNNSATDNTTLTPEADLVVSKTDGAASVVPGTATSYTITVNNTGPSCDPSVSVADTFVGDLSGVSWTCAGTGGASCGTASGSGNISTTDDLPDGGTVTYTVSANIDSCATGTLSNTASATASVTDPALGNNSATDTSTLSPEADLAVTKTDGQVSDIPGTSTGYTITVTNGGPSCDPSVSVADTFVADLTGVTWTCAASGGASCGTASGSGNIGTTDDLPDGGTVTYTVAANIDSCATGTLSNTATATSSVTDPVAGNNSATDNTTMAPQADLLVTKTDGQASDVPGTSTSYTITVSNGGPSCDPAVAVADTFVADLTGVTWTCAGAGGASCGTASGSGNIGTTDDLPDGGSVTYTVSANIDPCAVGTLANTATATSSVTDPVVGNNSATDNTTMTPEVDLSVTKTDSQASDTPGTTTQYTIVASNAGPSCEPSGTIGDTFDPILTGVTWTCAASGTATCPSASGSGDLNEVADFGESGTLTYTVDATIDACATGTLSNTVTATESGGVTDTDAGNNSATDGTTLVPEADVSVTKTDGQANDVPGTSTSYTITVSNAGPSCDPSVSFTDNFDANLTGVSWTCAATGAANCGSLSGSGDIATTDDLPDGTSVTYTVTADIDACLTGTLTNTATAVTSVTDPDGSNNSSVDTTTMTPEVDLSVTKTDSQTEDVPGTSTQYTIVASNTGPSCEPSAVIADTFVADLTDVTWTCSATGTAVCPSASGNGDISETADLGQNGTLTYTVDANIDPCAIGTLSNTATVTDSAGVTDTDAGNNSATDNTTMTPEVDLAITKTDGQATDVPGTSTQYTIVASNTGPSCEPAAVIADTFVADLTDVTWTCAASGTGVCPAASGSGDISETADLGENGSVTYTVDASIAPCTTGTLSNTATVTDSAGVTDTDAGNNSATDNTTMTPEVDLSVLKTDSQDTDVPGTSTQYIITVTNTGPSCEPAGAINDVFDAALTDVTWTCSAAGTAACPSASGAGNIAEVADFGELGTVTYTVDANIAPCTLGTLSNTATATDSVGVTDTDAGNNSATDNTTMTPEADLVISKVDSVDPTPICQRFDYTVEVTNNGPSCALGVEMVDSVQAELQLMNTNPPCAQSANNVTCSLGDLDPGASASVDLEVMTLDWSAMGTTSSNTASTSSDTDDPDVSNNAVTESTTISADSPYSVTVEGAPRYLRIGSVLDREYIVTLLSLCDPAVSTTSIYVDGDLPYQEYFVDSEPTPLSVTGNDVRFLQSSLAGGATAQWLIRSALDPTIETFSDDVVFSVDVSDAQGNTAEGSWQGGIRPEIPTDTGTLSMSITGPRQVLAGDALLITAAVSNASRISGENTVISVEAPADLLLVSTQPPVSAVTIDGDRATYDWLFDVVPGPGNQDVNLRFTVPVDAQDNSLITFLGVTSDDEDRVGESLLEITVRGDSTTGPGGGNDNLAALVTAPPTVLLGSRLSTTLSVSNSNNAPANGVVATLSAPESISFVSALPEPASVTTSGGLTTLTWTVGTLGGPGLSRIKVYHHVPTSVDVGTVVELSATVTDSAANTSVGSDTVTVRD